MLFVRETEKEGQVLEVAATVWLLFAVVVVECVVLI